MKRLFSCLLVASTTALTLAASPVWADEASTAQAEILLNTMGFKDSVERSIEPMVVMQIQQNPQLTPYKQVMLTFYRKHLSYDSMRPDMVRIYSSAFTAAELADINAFYQTETGKKAIQKMPELMTQGMQLGAKRVKDHLPELEKMIQDENARLAKENPPAKASK